MAIDEAKLNAALQANPGDATTAYLVLTADPADSSARKALWAAVTSRTESASPTPDGFPIAELLDDGSVAVPLFAPAAYGKGFALIRQGRYDEALASLREAAAADPLVTDRPLRSDEAKRGIAALAEDERN